jgi:hypothetical protein
LKNTILTNEDFKWSCAFFKWWWKHINKLHNLSPFNQNLSKSVIPKFRTKLSILNFNPINFRGELITHTTHKMADNCMTAVIRSPENNYGRSKRNMCVYSFGWFALIHKSAASRSTNGP